MTHPTLFSFLFSFALVAMLMPFMRKLARTTGFVDAPGGRKQHAKPVPPVGGLVIFPVFMAVSLLFGADFNYFWPLYGGIVMLLLMGSLDDRYQLSAWPKFIVQICVALAIVLSGNARLYQLGDLFGFGDVGLDFMSIPFSVIAVVLLINAMNLIDGLDGLAAGCAAIVIFWLMFAAYMAGQWGHVRVMAPLLGALLGFLLHNMRNPWRRKASVFLGDAGSMALGLILAWFCISLVHQKHQVLPPVSVAWILALPIIDTFAQFYRRISVGRHPFSPDRGHFHHHLTHAGISVERAVLFILSLSFTLGAIGYLGVYFGVPAFILTAGWAGLLVLHTVLSKRPWVYIRFFKKTVR